MSQNFPPKSDWRTVGYWFNDKKCQKFGGTELKEHFRKRKIRFTKIELSENLNTQGPFDGFLHKLTPLYSQASIGNQKAIGSVEAFEQFTKNHPEVMVMDPISSIKKLLLREETYMLLKAITSEEKQIFTPPFVTLQNKCGLKNKKLLEENGVTFPIVCKPLDAGGGPHAHQMALIRNANKMEDFPIPCVAESFIEHGAVLYKLFILGEKWFVSLRPSLKNFDAGDYESLYFNSHHISKTDSCSPLTHVDKDRGEDLIPKADLEIFQRIVTLIRESFLCDFLGIDIVIDVDKERYGIIDINPFPSYDMVPNLMEHIASAVETTLDSGGSKTRQCQFQPTSEIDQKYFLQNICNGENINE